MLYTSNYARKGRDEGSYAISRKAPDWYKGKEIDFLAPTWEIVMGSKEGRISHDQYAEMYLDLLNQRKFIPLTFMEWIESLECDVYLLCYEAPNEFCHRRVLAEYIEQDTGIKVPEWLNEKERKAKAIQESVDNLLTF